jgi:hypothetical protein
VDGRCASRQGGLRMVSCNLALYLTAILAVTSVDAFERARWCASALAISLAVGRCPAHGRASVAALACNRAGSRGLLHRSVDPTCSGPVDLTCSAGVGTANFSGPLCSQVHSERSTVSANNMAPLSSTAVSCSPSPILNMARVARSMSISSTITCSRCNWVCA